MRKTGSIILSSLLLTFVIFTIMIEAAESRHECSGEDCPICHLLLVTQDNLRLLGLTLGSVAVCISIYAVMTEVALRLPNVPTVKTTLITQKVRLND